MPRTLYRTESPRALRLNRPGERPAPLAFHLLENLLEARRGSMFPTNGAGPDEDVNIYLAHLLNGLLRADPAPGVTAFSTPLFHPPAGPGNRRERAQWYRTNADHRLVHQGLFGWGDGLRRRKTLHGISLAETRQRDLSAGRSCYAAAADLLRGRDNNAAALVMVWEKLAANYEDYVHVLGALATRHLGLGASLAPDALARLLPPAAPGNPTEAVADLLSAPPPSGAMDALLDLWLTHQKNPGPVTASRLQDMADRLGVDLDRLDASD